MRRFVFGLAILGCAAFAPLAARGDDQEIAKSVMQKLEKEKQAGNLRGFGIELKVDEGTVFMSGRVSTEEQRKMALECAQRTPGVKQVVNELAVSQAQNVKKVARESALPTAPTEALRSSRKSAAADAAGSPAAVVAQSPGALPGAPAQLRPVGQQPVVRNAAGQLPRAFAPAHSVAMRRQDGAVGGAPASPVPQYLPGSSGGVTPAQYDHPQMPGYAWPSYASHPNYAAVTYPKQYSPTAWPYIGPFYPYPQVPLGWRKVTLEWDDGWWMLDFQDR